MDVRDASVLVGVAELSAPASDTESLNAGATARASLDGVLIVSDGAGDGEGAGDREGADAVDKGALAAGSEF